LNNEIRENVEGSGRSVFAVLIWHLLNYLRKITTIIWVSRWRL